MASCRSSKPSRPQGVERNVVITVWDWSSPHAYLHDATVSDKRNPTVNANGLIFGATEASSSDNVPVFDPKTNTAYVREAAGARSEDAVGSRCADAGAVAV